MRNSRKQWKGRARVASAETDFERALLGEASAARRAWDPRADRKTLQLCQQVKRTLMLALAGECDDDLLRDVFVEAVEPMGNAGHLLVRISTKLDAMEVAARLNARSAKLRAIVAQAISRKRVPGLSFIAVPNGGGQP